MVEKIARPNFAGQCSDTPTLGCCAKSDLVADVSPPYVVDVVQ